MGDAKLQGWTGVTEEVHSASWVSGSKTPLGVPRGLSICATVPETVLPQGAWVGAVHAICWLRNILAPNPYALPIL